MHQTLTKSTLRQAQGKPFDNASLGYPSTTLGARLGTGRASVSGYKGAVGDTIRIRATDDFKVKQVQVTITNADGG